MNIFIYFESTYLILLTTVTYKLYERVIINDLMNGVTFSNLHAILQEW